MKQAPKASFVDGLRATICYWQQCTYQLADSQIRSLKTDHANLLRLALFGLKLEETQPGTITLILQVFPLIERVGYWQSWLPILKQACDEVDEEAWALQCQLLNRLGQLYRLTLQLEQAVATHEKAEMVAQKLGDKLLLAEVYFHLCADFRQQRAYGKAEERGGIALRLLADLDEFREKRAAILNTLGQTALGQGDHAVAESRLQEAVALWRLSEQPTELARTLNNLARTLHAQKKFDMAMVHYREAVSLLATTASELDKIKIELNLGALYYEQGNLTQAEFVLRQAELVLRRQQMPMYYQAVVTQSLGNVLLKQQRLIEAEINLRRSMALWRKTGDSLMLANTLGTLAEALVMLGMIDEACALFTEAMTLLEVLSDNTWAGKLLTEFKEQWAHLDECG